MIILGAKSKSCIPKNILSATAMSSYDIQLRFPIFLLTVKVKVFPLTYASRLF